MVLHKMKEYLHRCQSLLSTDLYLLMHFPNSELKFHMLASPKLLMKHSYHHRERELGKNINTVMLHYNYHIRTEILHIDTTSPSSLM